MNLIEPGAANADIRRSRHNLAQSLPAGAQETEVCVFCHTPQAGSPETAAKTPLWVRSQASADGFALYNDINLGGEPIEGGRGSHSFVCLSCHDGSQAGSAPLNGPSVEHPWGIPYRGSPGSDGGRIALAGMAEKPGAVSGALAPAEEFKRAASGMIGGRRVWWVPHQAGESRRTRNDIPLYSRGALGDEIPFIECASCHDPHSDRAMFLRVSNEGSRLCYACHSK